LEDRDKLTETSALKGWPLGAALEKEDNSVYTEEEKIM